jgi:hypothetical protein
MPPFMFHGPPSDQGLRPRTTIMTAGLPPPLRYLYCLDCGADVRVQGLDTDAARPLWCVICESRLILSALGAPK